MGVHSEYPDCSSSSIADQGKNTIHVQWLQKSWNFFKVNVPSDGIFSLYFRYFGIKLLSEEK